MSTMIDSPAPASPQAPNTSQRMARALEQHLSETAAHAAVVLRGGKTWCAAGKLDPAAQEELAQILNQAWHEGDQADLARFIRLGWNQVEYLMYATGLPTGGLLALIFDAATPIMRIRTAVKRLAREALLPVDDLPQASLSTAEQPAQAGVEEEPQDEWPEAEEGEEFQFSLAELLASMPSPDPHPNSISPNPDWEFPEQLPTSPDAISPATDDASLARLLDQAIQAQPVDVPAPDVPFQPSAPAATQPEPLPETLPILAALPAELAAVQSEDDGLADTQPIALHPAAQLDDLEPTSPALSFLDYTCVLLPRLPQHYLIGELASRLSEWMPQACLAFGWRLQGLSVRPEFMQWVVQVSPAISPGNLVRIFRQHTSQSIFAQYPNLAIENPSGDFWAPGYLIFSGAQPPSVPLLREYIQQTRRRQGIARP